MNFLLGSGEREGDNFIPQPKVRSRQFPIKYIFIGVVGRPWEQKWFNGRILLSVFQKQITAAIS